MSRWDIVRLNAGWREDGHPHERDENGFCGNCGARKGESHYKLKPRSETN